MRHYNIFTNYYHKIKFLNSKVHIVDRYLNFFIKEHKNSNMVTSLIL